MEAFRQYLSDRLGVYVQVERSGPDACQGWVLHVGRDYLTLYCVDGTRLHLPLHHIRSVTPLLHPVQEYAPPAAPLDDWPETYGELLARHIGQVVRLNHAGPELNIGTLRAITDDYLLVEIAPAYDVCHARFHLRSLCLYTVCEAVQMEGAIAVCRQMQS